MAVSNTISPTKIEVYESLYLICQASLQITEQLERLRSVKILDRPFVEINREIALQLRAEVTTAAVHHLTAPEIDDAYLHESNRLRMKRKLERSEVKVKSRIKPKSPDIKTKMANKK